MWTVIRSYTNYVKTKYVWVYVEEHAVVLNIYVRKGKGKVIPGL